ncbi:MAG: CDP-alcohol phosphatidyltransferase family protein [Gammaproteobacteria bacterium]|nr:CDP-alcohol phosphatidyltransferase family protein [Gammaproteobacteria bacterium]
MKLSHLPNAITIGRMAFVPLLILTLKDGRFLGALGIFLVAGVSDALDGYIAKHFGCTSRLGAILDPAADKILLVSAYVMLAWLHLIPFWLVLAVVFRDMLIVGGYFVYVSLYGPVHMRPSYVSKFNTFVQIVLVLFLLAERALDFRVPYANEVLVFSVLATTLASGLHYLWTWGVMKDIEVTGGKRS